MKKIYYVILFLLVSVFLFSCSNKESNKKMMLGGEEYDSIFVRSGYYFDKASLSEATLIDMLEKVEVVEKPSSLGEVELPEFSSILLTTQPMPEVNEEQIDAEIERERDKETSYSPVKVKREAKMTDRVTIDFKGYVDGKAFEGGESTDYVLVLGSGAFIPGFEESVAGHMAGNQFSINVKFPDDYAETLAGKDAKFDITIKNIEEANSPVFDDEFVKKHTKKNSKTISEYKEEVKQRIEGKNEFLKNQDLTYQLFDKLITDGKYYPTEEALAWQFSVVLNQIKAQVAQSGLTLESALNTGNGTINDTFADIKNNIPEIIKEQMATDAIIAKYKVDITEDEVKDWFNDMSSLMGYDIEISYEDYMKYVGKEVMFESAKQYKVLTTALNDCTIAEESLETD